MDPKLTGRNIPVHRNCFLIFQAENWDNVSGKLLNWQLFPSLSQDANAGSNFHCWSQCEFFFIPLTIRNSDMRKKKSHQNSAGFNFPSLNFNLTTTVHSKNANMIFAADRKERACWELSCCLIALKSLLQKLKWWNSAWNVLGAFTGREMRRVNFQLGAASLDLYAYALKYKDRIFFFFLWLICGFILSASGLAIQFGERRTKEVPALSPSPAFSVLWC